MATPTELYINAELPKRPYTAQYPLTAGHVPVATGIGLEVAARQLDVTDVANAASETYVNDAINALVDGAPAALDTLNELAAAINDDANYAATVTTALGNRLRVDVNTQGLTNTEKQNGLDNLGITEVITDASVDASGLITFTKNTGQTADTVQIPTALNDLTFNSTTGVLTLKHTNGVADSTITVASNEIADDVFRVKDNVDGTKKIAFEASGISTATTRTITMPDVNVNLGNISSGLSYNSSTKVLTLSQVGGGSYTATVPSVNYEVVTGGTTVTVKNNTHYVLKDNGNVTLSIDPVSLASAGSVIVTATTSKTVTISATSATDLRSDDSGSAYTYSLNTQSGVLPYAGAMIAGETWIITAGGVGTTMFLRKISKFAETDIFRFKNSTGSGQHYFSSTATTARSISMPDANVDLNNTITGGSYSGGVLTLNKPSGTHTISIPGSSGAVSAQTNFTLSKNTRYLISSDSIVKNVTLTMPASPTTGDWVEIFAQSNTGGTKYVGGLILNGNGSNITPISKASASTYTFPNNAANAILIYSGGVWNLSITPNTSIYGNSHNVDETLATAAIAGAGHVVSGSNSAILSGSANYVTGTGACILAGSSNIVSGNSAFIGGGLSNTANKQYSVILTGSSCLAAGTLSVILTGRGVQTTLGGAVIQGPYQTPANYVAAMIQNSILFGTTTNASTAQLDAAGGGSVTNAGDKKILPAIAPVAAVAGSPGGVGVHEIALTAKSTSGTFRAFSSTYHVTCSYDGSTYAIDGVTTLHSTSRSASTLSVAFSISGNQLIISCTNSDAVSNTISWVASVKSTYN